MVRNIGVDKVVAHVDHPMMYPTTPLFFMVEDLCRLFPSLDLTAPLPLTLIF